MSLETFLSLNDCSFSYSKLPILRKISISVHNNEKIALIGKNGVGKSTFMQILNKEKEPESGKIWFDPNLTIGFLKQKYNFLTKETVKNFLERNLLKSEFEKASYKVDLLCEKLKIEPTSKINHLSGGITRKLSLAQVILSDSKFLLLDEPTNHLDIESIEWLETYLNKDFKGSFLIVSHDRKFLSNVTNKVFWMDRGEIKVSPKGFYNFEEWSNNLIQQESRVLKNKSNHLKQELEWLSKGVKARRKRNERRLKQIKILEKNYKKDNSDFLRSIRNIKFNISTDERLGPNIIAQFFNVSKSFFIGKETRTIIDQFSYKLVKGEKIGILGKNGAGKSTFLKLLIKEITPDIGTVKIRESVEYSYFEQNSSQVSDDKTIKENMIPDGGDYIDNNGFKQHICGYLKNFLFEPSSVNDLAGTLSGGQKNRLLLAKTLASPKQLLILDEPTNDLDLETLDMLTEFIENFKGTIIIASHDRDFLDQTVDKKFFFSDNGKITQHYEDCSKILGNKEKDLNKEIKLENKNIEKKLLEQDLKFKPIPFEKEIKRILIKIEKVEKKIEELYFLLEDKSLFVNNKNKFTEITEDIKFFQNELFLLEKKWNELEENNLKKNL